jgi:hypothetical protein
MTLDCRGAAFEDGDPPAFIFERALSGDPIGSLFNVNSEIAVAVVAARAA